jgi:hypothetical protein
MKFPQRLILVCSLLALLAGCEKTLQGIRTVTYPPDFNYISGAELDDTMHQFALYTTLLDQGLRNAPNVTIEQRAGAIDILRKMEKLSRQLGTESLSSNHAVVSFNIDRFRQSIVDARIALQQEPPNFYQVGAVSAYCLNCHVRRTLD